MPGTLDTMGIFVALTPQIQINKLWSGFVAPLGPPLASKSFGP